MKQFQQMFLAQLKLTLREKQAWFWGIFFPVILMSIFMVIFAGGSNEEFQSSVAIVKPNQNETSDMMLAQLQQIPNMDIKSEQPVSLENATEWVEEKKVDAAIVLPDSTQSTSIELIVNKENEQSMTTQMIYGILDQFVQQTNLNVAGATPIYEVKYTSISAGTIHLTIQTFF